MKSILIKTVFILLILVFCGAAHAEEEKQTVVLRYSSFDGGGYLYSVRAEDEAILSADVRYDYGNQNHEMEDGSPFDALITLTALAPGTTEVVIQWESPILPPGEAHYIATVLDDMTVQLEEKPYMRVSIYDVPLIASLEENETAAAFAALLPLRIDMEELNGNEIYHDLFSPLPSSPERIGHVEAGDIMLFGDHCVVIFYQAFDTPYAYTRIGRIADTEKLMEAIDGQGAYVSFEKMED